MKKPKSNSKPTPRPTKKVGRLTSHQKTTLPLIARWYGVFSVAVLLLTSGVWAALGARLQQSNADQLVNAYLFEHAQTFHGALLPTSHSFLIKWPLFLLIKTLGSSSGVFAAVSIAVTLFTVAALAFVLWRIDRRPWLFGTLCLALASVLLLVPPQPYAGALLPVNMAMLATRNLEYVLYIGALWLLVRSRGFKSRGFWLAVGGLGLLAASDKLFLSLSVGGSALALITYGLARQRELVRLCVRWLAVGGLALGMAIGLLWLVRISGLTHLTTNQASGPYGLIHDSKDLIRGVVFAGWSILTNLGANPAFDATTLRAVPHLTESRLVSPLGVTFVINGAILVIGAYVVFKLLVVSFMRSKIKKTKKALPEFDNPTKLSLLLIWSSLAALGAFIVTSHYYLVDARYLTIILFSVFISAATFLRKRAVPSTATIILIGAVLTMGITVGLISTGRTFRADRAALAAINQRNALIAATVKHHPVDVVVGDYWRVLPIKAASSRSLQVMPLDNCTQKRDVLSSQSWQFDLDKHSFAYVLSFDKSLTNFPICTLEQVVATYGRPNASTLIAGRPDKPVELLLLYDHGAHQSAPVTNRSPTPSSSTVLPITLAQLPARACPGRSTIINIVAHQDDDLLFMSPDLLKDVAAKHCVRTVYVTAGDAGSDALYWLARERGSQAAYSTMIGTSTIWVQRTVKLADNEFITVTNPRGNFNISLIFMRLSDGNVSGQGFKTSRNESLARLEAGKITYIDSVDGQSTYSSDQLTKALSNIMETYKPTEIRTQATYNTGRVYVDHSDHLAVGRFTRRAYQLYPAHANVPIKYYSGYPVHEMAENVFGEDLQQKTAAFLAYSQFDEAVCHSTEQCNHMPSYGSYLKRQYAVP